MQKGMVKWFNNTKGWGFIQSEEGGEDIFVHYSVIKGDGFRRLEVGQMVSYECKKGDKGYQATEVLKEEN